MVVAGKHLNTTRKPSHTATFSTTNPTWTGLASNPDPRIECLATNRLSHGTGFNVNINMNNIYIYKYSVRTAQ
jgi:hypothetical protein